MQTVNAAVMVVQPSSLLEISPHSWSVFATAPIARDTAALPGVATTGQGSPNVVSWPSLRSAWVRIVAKHTCTLLLRAKPWDWNSGLSIAIPNWFA